MDILQKRTWAQIDLDAAAHNFKEIRRYVGNRSMVCCVIKADAYGHGAVRMAEEYEALGADWLALSNIEEALQVRRAGIKLPLLVLGYHPGGSRRRACRKRHCAVRVFCRILRGALRKRRKKRR